MTLKSLPQMQNSYQLAILKSILDDEEIPYFVRNENLLAAYGFIPDFQEELQVSEESYDRAIEIIKKGFPEITIE
jgi:hypothetical protein